jgi:hypothetical protein
VSAIVTSDAIECPGCGRVFSQDAFARHVTYRRRRSRSYACARVVELSAREREYRRGLCWKRLCVVCSATFYAYRAVAKYCGRAACLAAGAAQIRRAKRARARTKTCATCSAPFIGTRTDSAYCSSACRQRAYRARVTALACGQIDAIPASVTDGER